MRLVRFVEAAGGPRRFAERGAALFREAVLQFRGPRIDTPSSAALPLSPHAACHSVRGRRWAISDAHLTGSILGRRYSAGSPPTRCTHGSSAARMASQ